MHGLRDCPIPLPLYSVRFCVCGMRVCVCMFVYTFGMVYSVTRKQ